MINKSNKRSLADLISAFDTKTTETSNTNDDWKKFFPFYKMAVDAVTTVRFLPDLDEDNPRGFVVENFYHEFTINGRKERVACLHPHGKECPACKASQEFYAEFERTKDVSAQKKGKALYRKKSYIAQALILETPLPMREDAPLVWLLDFGPQIYNKMLSDMKSGDLENNPIDFNGGHNFRIRKSLNGTENSYATSSFSPKATDLPEDMLDSIVDGLYDLKEFMTKQVDPAVMETMVNAAIMSLGGTVSQQVQQVQQAPATKPEPRPTTTAAVAQQAPDLGDDSPDVGAEVATAPAPTAAPAQSARDVIRNRAAALRAARGE